jgi:Xaa-Pro aminopeptidase
MMTIYKKSQMSFLFFFCSSSSSCNLPGFAVITETQAALWTDGRYFLQASQQLDGKHWTLMKQGLPETPSFSAWLIQVLPPNSRVGVDARLISISKIPIREWRIEE